MSVASPVFIAGIQRSGTTLLRLMLDHHPDICIFGEFDYAFDISDPKSSNDYCSYLDWLQSNRIFQDQGWSISGNNHDDFLNDILRQAKSRSGKEHVGAAIHRNFKRALAIWPDSRFIHLCRDPRDVARSWIGMGWSGSVLHGARAWRSIENEWTATEQHLNAGSHMTILYEDLIKEPERVLETASSFLHVSYRDAMLKYADKTTYSTPDPNLVRQWQHKISARDRRIVESVCGDLMLQRGYTDVLQENRKLPLRDRIESSLIDWYKTKLFRIKRYGLKLYIQEAAARRLGSASWRHRVKNRVNEVARQHIK